MDHNLALILLVLAIVWFATLPRWPYSQTWGYRPFGIGGIILVIVVLFLLFGSGHSIRL